MEELVSALIFLFVCVSVWAFATWQKLKNAENLKEWVTWSVLESDDARWNIPLWEHLKNAQLHSNVSEQYRITGDEEWQTAKDIISRYKKNLTQSYFNGQVWTLKSIYTISGKDYFIYMLYVYLCEHEMSGNNVVFHKMHYITYMYCKKNLALQKNITAWNESRLKESIDEDMLNHE